MGRRMPMAMQLHLLKTHIVRHGHDPETVDLQAYIDPTLSYPENRENINRILNIGRLRGTATWREQDRQYKHIECMSLQERCLISLDRDACQEYADITCIRDYGDVEDPDGNIVYPTKKKTPRKRKPKLKPKLHPMSRKSAYIAAYMAKQPPRRVKPPVKKPDVKPKVTKKPAPKKDSCKVGYRPVRVAAYTVPRHTRCIPKRM